MAWPCPRRAAGQRFGVTKRACPQHTGTVGGLHRWGAGLGAWAGPQCPTFVQLLTETCSLLLLPCYPIATKDYDGKLPLKCLYSPCLQRSLAYSPSQKGLGPLQTALLPGLPLFILSYKVIQLSQAGTITAEQFRCLYKP